MDDMQNALIWIVVGLVVLVIHFVPSYVAFSRNHPSVKWIVILNILMGWTGIGWLLLLVWALSGGEDRA